MSSSGVRLSKADLIAFAVEMYAEVKNVIDDEAKIIDYAWDYVEELKRSMERVRVGGKSGWVVPTRLVHLGFMLQSNDGMVEICASARWAHCGFPQITLGHKFTAALLVTNATDEAIRSARPPFPAFMIEVPDGLLSVTDPNTKQPDPIRRILVSRQDNPKVPEGWSWAYTAYSEKGTTLYRFGVRSEELLPPWITQDVLEGGRERVFDTSPLAFELSDTDKRMSALLGRLIVNTCLAFSDPTKVREVGPGHAAWKSQSKGNARTKQEPVVRNFQLGSTVKHDFREHVRAYAAGERKEISVQVLVAGHYKMQPHGPKSSLRKLIWREPYWRGDEEAPILIRSHSFGES